MESVFALLSLACVSAPVLLGTCVALALLLLRSRFALAFISLCSRFVCSCFALALLCSCFALALLLCDSSLYICIHITRGVHSQNLPTTTFRKWCLHSFGRLMYSTWREKVDQDRCILIDLETNSEQIWFQNGSKMVHWGINMEPWELKMFKT